MRQDQFLVFNATCTIVDVVMGLIDSSRLIEERHEVTCKSSYTDDVHASKTIAALYTNYFENKCILHESRNLWSEP